MKAIDQAWNGVSAVMVAIFAPIVLLSLVIGLTVAIMKLFIFGFLVAIFSLHITLILGVPIYLILKATNTVSPISLTIFGAPICSAVGLWLFSHSDKLMIGSIFFVIGIYCSIAFWYGAEKLDPNFFKDL